MWTCRTFALRCLTTLASTLRGALRRYAAIDASVLVVQLSEVVRGCLDPQLVEHGVAALQAVAEASVAAGVVHMRCTGASGQAYVSQHVTAPHAACDRDSASLLCSGIAVTDPPARWL